MTSSKLVCYGCGKLNRFPTERRLEAVCAACGAKLVDGAVAPTTLPNLLKSIRNDDLVLVALFWSPGCQICEMMMPQFEHAAGALIGRARLVSVNTTIDGVAGPRFCVSRVPTMVGLKGGHEAKRRSGMMQMAQIVSWAPR
jgi:thioredoxin 2